MRSHLPVVASNVSSINFRSGWRAFQIRADLHPLLRVMEGERLYTVRWRKHHTSLFRGLLPAPQWTAMHPRV
jgi:hypothetical protein